MGVIDEARSRRARRRALRAVAVLGAVVLALAAIARVGAGGPAAITGVDLGHSSRAFAVQVVCSATVGAPGGATAAPLVAPLVVPRPASTCVAYRSVRVPAVRRSPEEQARVNARALL